MNRKVLAVAITALLAANAANAAEIYNKDGNKVELKGKLEASYTFRGDSERYDIPTGVSIGTEAYDNEDDTFARLGFHGETQINSQLTGYGVFEYEFTPKNRPGKGEEDEFRLGYAGLKYANLGSLDFGRNVGVVELVRDFTDVAPVFGGDGFGGGHDIFMTGRASGVATYSVQDAYGYVDGLNMYLQYQAKNSEKASSLKEANGDGIAFTTTYEHDLGFGGAFTYANSDRTENQRFGSPAGTDGNYAEIWGIAAKYDANNVYAALSWAQSNNMFEMKTGEFAHKTRGLEAIAAYTFDFGLTPSVTYNQMRARDLRAHSAQSEFASAYVVKYVALGAEYEFNKNMDMGLGYKINLLDEEAAYTNYAGLETDDQVEMRLTYSF